jgi:hypothetical protein
MAPVPPGTGGGEGVSYGRTGKGILIHHLPDATGMPWSTRPTPANGDEWDKFMDSIAPVVWLWPLSQVAPYTLWAFILTCGGQSCQLVAGIWQALYLTLYQRQLACRARS